jgi:hypothetical protein
MREQNLLQDMSENEYFRRRKDGMIFLSKERKEML